MSIADFGAGAQVGLKQLLLQRLQAQAYADRMKQQSFENERQLAGDQRADQAQTIAQQRYAAEEAQRQQERDAAQGDKLNESIPGDTRLAPTDRAVGYLRTAGVPLQPVPGVAAMGPDFQGPMENGVTPQQAQTGISGGFLKTASAAQQSKAADAGRKDWEAGIKQELADLKSGQAPTSSYQLQPEIDPKTGQQTGRFLGYNTKANRFEPISGATPQATKAGPGAAQNAQHEQAKHEALGSLDQLDQAIEAAKDLVGPGAGRVSSIQQMIGNPDPRISALGTKMLLAKMQVDHAASGTVRAGASPQILSRWDNILGNNQTPEGLKASVQAMREILGGQAAAAVSAQKPSAEDLIKKYGGGR